MIFQVTLPGNLTVGISDHMPQFALIPNNQCKSDNKARKKI